MQLEVRDGIRRGADEPAVKVPEVFTPEPAQHSWLGFNLAQGVRLLTALVWLGYADWWVQQSGVPYAPLMAIGQAAAAVVVMALAVLTESREAQRRLDRFLFTGTLFIIAMVAVATGAGAGYGTDELAYDQAAAAGLLHGANPYVTDFTATLHQFGVASGGTMTLNGTHVPFIAYPALSFLLYLPLVAVFGEHSYAGLMVDVFAWIGAGLILWRLISEAARPWITLLLALPVLLVPVTGGITDSLYVPFVLVALCCWDRFADPTERSAARWIGPVALGLACCIKQSPWLLAPLLTVGVAFESRRRGQDWRRVTLRYVAIAAGAFLVANLPFIVWDPGAWVSRVLLPVAGALVPMGVGPAGLLRAFGLGGGNLTLFGFASVAALIAVIALFVVRYPQLKRILPVLPLAALFVSSRSLATYFAFAIPAVAINAATVRPITASMIRSRFARGLSVVAVGAAAVSAGFVVAALADAPPLRIGVTSSHVTATTFISVVTVDNLSGRTVEPHFILADGTTLQQEIRVESGPATLPPQGSAIYELAADVTAITPLPGGTFQIQAGTVSPNTISSSPVATVPAGG